MKHIRKNYKLTIYACYTGYIVQGIINNISPILFATYQRMLGVSVDRIGILIAMNFGIQIIVDLLAAKYVDKIGCRKCMVFAHVSAVMGVLGIGLLPRILPDAFAGLILATALSAVGGGLLEVLVSPVVEAAPGDEKEQAMSMLHSFYCWGCVGFILISTLLLKLLGPEHWYIMPLLWAIVPAVNIVSFLLVPINTLVEEKERVSVLVFIRQGTFWIFILLMLCSGASEMAMSQWASYFAEIGLNVSKTTGDLLGPCAFCLLMGLARLFYGKKGGRIRLEKFMSVSSILCICAYLLAVIAPHPILSLAGCALCGLSVGILWPGTFSLAAARCKSGGTAVFALMALAGDIGCMAGPEVVGMVSEAVPGAGLKAGFAAAMIFPAIMLVLINTIRKEQ